MTIPFSPQPKTKHIRIKPKLKQRSEFSTATRKQIKLNANGCCQICGAPYAHEIHHVRFRSQQGRGVETNGALLCTPCHRNVHQNRELAVSLQQEYEEKYGPNYYRDKWDIPY